MIDARVSRYLEIGHQGIIPSHHFAEASSECINLYRDGYFLGAVMLSHAVNEGIWKFVLERNQIPRAGELEQQVSALAKAGIVSQGCCDAFARIWGSFRNDVHHMNPRVSSIPFDVLAKRNLEDLATIENEIFATTVSNGRLVALQPKYWDIGPDGHAPTFLRLE